MANFNNGGRYYPVKYSLDTVGTVIKVFPPKPDSVPYYQVEVPAFKFRNGTDIDHTFSKLSPCKARIAGKEFKVGDTVRVLGGFLYCGNADGGIDNCGYRFYLDDNVTGVDD